MKIKNSKGFTLIELLIVVAIIAILAAIAIPQFSAYRIRGYNSAAVADLRNARTAEEAFFSDWQAYASTDANGKPGATAAYITTTGDLTINAGDINAGPPPIPSAKTKFNTGISQNVTLFVQTLAPSGAQATLGTKNTSGNICYAQDTSGSTIYWEYGTAQKTGDKLLAAGIPAPVAGANAFATAATPPVYTAGVAPCDGNAAWANL